MSLLPKLIDGNLSDWNLSERIDYGYVAGYTLYGTSDGTNLYFALTAPTAIGANTTFWFNTDQNALTGYLVFGYAIGAEYNVNVAADGTLSLYSGGAGETAVVTNLTAAYSADGTTLEFAVPLAAIGNPGTINTVYDVNDAVFSPPDYTTTPYVVYNTGAVRTDPMTRIGIVYSQTTASHYFSETAYSHLFMAVQSQAMQAGVAFDLLSESDLTDLSKLANYDALVFPDFSHVQSSQVLAITDTLLQATREFGIGIITSGNFMTNDETGAALPGNAYAREMLLLDAERVTGGFPANVTINSSDTNHTVFTTLDAGDLIHSYTSVGWDYFTSSSGTGQVIATQTVNGDTFAAAIATQTGGKNVVFSTPGVMADNNLLWQAIDYVTKDPGVQVGLNLTRFKGIVQSRTDMDQAMEVADVTPDGGAPGIYDALIPILQQWKQTYNFVGSYYVDIGNDPQNDQQTNWAISAPYYAQILALGNEIGTHSYTHPDNTDLLTPAQIQFEFQQSAAVIEQQMSAYLGTPFHVVGTAVPGNPESLPTSQDIIQYFNYMSGGYSAIGAGYPGAFGFLTPADANAIYLAPNTSFDFSLVEYQNLGAAGAEVAWQQEWDTLLANANTPIVVWPWHDYGPTEWPTSPPQPSPYTTEMYTNWIARAYQSGAEFVTGADLAARMMSYADSGVVSSVNGNVISATVTSSHAGNFALDVSHTSGQVIQSVAGWYAYDSDSLFLPETGGTYTITLGATADDVTHITALPMRGDLLSLTGDGLNLSFSIIGEGQVLIDLGPIGNRSLDVSGATIASLVGDQLTLDVGTLGLHNVAVRLLAPPPTEIVSTVSFSDDSGANASDFITNVASQAVAGTLSAPLGTGNVVRISLDNGVTWQTATANTGDTAFTLPGAVLTGSNTLIVRVENTDGIASTALSQAYILDQTPPGATASIASMTNDSGIAGDFVTNDGSAGRTVTGVLSTALPSDETLEVSLDGGTTWASPILNGTDWTIVDAAGHTTGWTIATRVVDLAGNIGQLTTQAVTYDAVAPLAPGLPDLADASDSGTSNTDNLTNIVLPTLTGNAEADSTVTLLEGSTVLGSAVASATGDWSLTLTQPLSSGVHALTAQATDLAGNTGAVSLALAVTVDTTAPAAPSTPNMTAATDTGSSAGDNITANTTPTFTGTAEANSTVTLLDGTAVVGSAIATAGKWTITSATLTDGIHAIAATATDAAGNVSTISLPLTVTIATAVPPPSTPDMTATTDKGASSTDDITNDNTPTFTGTSAPTDKITLYDGSTVVGTGTTNTSGVWTITTSTLSDGAHDIAATATDKAGNVSGLTPALTVMIDTGVPLSPSAPDLLATSDTGASDTDNVTALKTPTFTGTAEAGSTVIIYNGTANVGTGIADQSGTWTITTAALANGVRSITAKSTDVAGNVSASSAPLLVTIDAAVPAAPSRPDLLAVSDTGSSSTDNITSINTPTFNGTAEANAVITLMDDAGVIGTTTAVGGAWSIKTVPLADGVHNITATATDLAGNVSGVRTPLPVTIDTAPPAAPALTAGTATRITGSGEPGATVTVLNGSTIAGTAAVNSSGVWTWQFTTATAVRTFTAVQVDKAGNTSGASGLAIVGTAASNTLNSTAGDDLLIGGGSADTFAFGAQFGHDIIAEFAATGGAHDFISFAGSPTLTDFTAVMANAVQVGANVLITQDAGNTLTLNNVTRGNLTAADFKFA